MYTHALRYTYMCPIEALLLRKDLQEMCASAKLKKTGNVSDLKESLLDHHLTQTLSQSAVLKYADGVDAAADALAGPGSEDPPPEAHQDVQQQEQLQEAPVAAGNDDPGASGAADSAPLLWGRQTFRIGDQEQSEDKTNWFAGISDGPEIKTGEATILETMLEATSGVIPVAACIKITQGFQEAVDGPQAVLLLSGGLDQHIVTCDIIS